MPLWAMTSAEYTLMEKSQKRRVTAAGSCKVRTGMAKTLFDDAENV